MDKGQAIEITRAYKRAIKDKVDSAKVYLYGSYSKGNAHAESDIDVAVIVPKIKDNWLSLYTDLWMIAPQVNLLIEPVLMEEGSHSPLYDDVMKTGIAV